MYTRGEKEEQHCLRRSEMTSRGARRVFFPKKKNKNKNTIISARSPDYHAHGTYYNIYLGMSTLNYK